MATARMNSTRMAELGETAGEREYISHKVVKICLGVGLLLAPLTAHQPIRYILII